MAFLKSKTINYGLLISILGIIQTNIESLELSNKTQGLVLIGIGIGIAILRTVTDKPLSKK